jgi:hypothetical protein
MMTLRNMREQVPKPLNVSIRQMGAHFRVVYQRQYPNAVEEVVLSTRFNTQEEAQSFADEGLRAQRIYRSLGQWERG